MFDKAKKLLENKRIQTIFVTSIFIIYFFIGAFLVGDYGVSTDEPHERRTMYINLNYIKTKLGSEPMDVQDLMTYEERYYGMALQMPMVLFEKLADDVNEVYLGRHFYTFCLCFIGYIFFYLLCKRLFDSKLIGILGTLMLMLYPRFFAEQFYNIKDMVFMSSFIVAMWATERLITNNFSVKWILLFSCVVAITTNVRIVGVIFIMVVLGYIWCCRLIQTITGKEIHCNLTYGRTIRVCVGIALVFIIVFAASIPAVWENPLREIINVFTTFSDYEWIGNIVFCGESTRGVQIPWYYIPVWIMISVPLWYIILVIVTACICVMKSIGYVKNGNWLDMLIKYKYLVWVAMLFLGPWFGMVLIESNLYNAWRHCYFMLSAMVILGLYGLKFIMRSGKKIAFVGVSVAILCLSVQGGWIVKNHPHEMVYLNPIGRIYGADFDRDYWHLSEYQAWKYIAEHDDSETITVDSSGTKFFEMRLSQEDKDRVVISDDPTYYIYTYRGHVGNDYEKEGYEEYYSFVVDGFKVATILKSMSE